MRNVAQRVGALVGLAMAGLLGATAQDGKAGDGQLGFQKAASPVMEQLNSFHNALLVVITLIVLLVLGLLAYVAVRYNRKANPAASKISHNTLIEVIWTSVPVAILVLIAIPSFNLLYYQDREPEPDLVIKATGYQWYWEYEYPQQDNGEDGIQLAQPISFAGYMVPVDAYEPGNEAQYQQAQARLKDFLGLDQAPELTRLLDTDTRVVVPVDTTVVVEVTAGDVLHSFTVPAFGFKMDAVPGRLNRTWFKATRTGTFYGQCSELCGKDHAYMPIAVEVVSREAFDAWVARRSPSVSARASDQRERAALLAQPALD